MRTCHILATNLVNLGRWTCGRFVWLALCVLPALAVNSPYQISEYTHTSWGPDAGIQAVRRIKQTPDGYLWLATRVGLVRFDGVRFTTFTAASEQGLESSTMQDLLIDPDGSIWIATLGGGVAHYQAGKFHTYTMKDGLPSDEIGSLCMDSRGTLWIGTRGGEIARLVGGHFEKSPLKFPPSRINALLEGPDHSLWIAGGAYGVFRLRNGIVTSYTVNDGIPDDRIAGIYRDHSGRIWTAGYKGISFWNGKRFVAHPALNAILGDGEAVSLTEDHDGNLWVASSSGLFRVSGKHATKIDRMVLSGGFASAVFEDREGELWVGTRGGLDRFRNEQVRLFKLPNDFARPIIADDRGVWAVSNREITRIIANTIRTWPLSFPAGSTPVTLLSEPDGGFLVGFDKGASSWTSKRVQSISSLSGLNFKSLLRAHDGSIWIGTANRGLLRWLPSKGSKGLTETGVPDRYISTLAEDGAGAIWAGSDGGGGLYRLSGGKVQHFGREEGLRSPEIYTVFVDGKGRLWIGSAGGLSWFQDGRIYTINSQHGLPADQVFAILGDSYDRLWCAGFAGIVAIDRKSLFEFTAGRRHNFDPIFYRSFKDLQVYTAGGVFQIAAQTPDGHLWFSMPDGLVEVTPPYPATLHASQFPVLVEDVTVDGVPHAELGQVRMPPGTRSIELRYTALTLSNAEAVRFRYRLEGFDNDWVEAATRRLAFYSNLKPGTYKFRVAASTGQEPWQESSALTLVQLPFFYQTNWFLALCSGAFLAILAAIYRVRVRQLRNEERKFREAIETMPALAFIAMPNGQLTFVNDRWIEYTGLTEELASRRGWQAVIHPDDINRVLETWKVLQSSGDPLEYEARLHRSTDGIYRWFQTRAVPVRDRRGRIVKWYGVITDIEDRKRAEHLQTELAHTNRISLLGELTASISHELKQPIAAAVTNARTSLRWLKRDQPDLDEVRQAAERIVQDGARATQILDGLRALYKKSPPKRELVDANDIIIEMMVMLRGEANRFAVSIGTALAADIPKVTADRVQLQQVLMNLMLNGIEAMNETGGTLTLKSQREAEDKVIISVSDTGVGLPSEKADQIFEAFFTTKPQGSGMGLAISRSIIESHGGRLWATANDGRGTSFCFTLPSAAGGQP